MRLGRAVALFLGVFVVGNVVGEIFRPGFDQSVLLVSLRPLPPSSARLLLLLAGLLLLAFAVRPALSPARRVATAGAVGLLLLAAAGDSIEFFRLLDRGAFRPAVRLPLTAVSGLALVPVLWAVLSRRGARSGDRLALIVVPVALAVLFPLLQMEFFGRTDYRRPADAAVVFGARVYADGRPSTALADRVRTAARLWREGEVRWLVLSGGPGDGTVNEAEAMRSLAVSLGVDPGAVVTDDRGTSTRATVANAGPILTRLGARRAIAVSHACHLPRVKMAFHQAGREVYTVPAKESYRLRQMPRYVAREVVAFWAYWAF